MSHSARSAPSPPRVRGRLGFGLVRSASDRVVAGVAAGLGDRLGVDRVVIRLAFVVLALAGGVGIVAYLVLWLLSEDPEPGTPVPVRDESPDEVARRTVALGLVVAGTLLLCRAFGAWLGDALVWPVALGALGSAVIWVRADEASRARWSSRIPRTNAAALLTQRVTRGRLVLGGLLIAGGMAAFLAANHAFAQLGDVAVAVGVTLAGVVLILGPGMLRLGRQLGEERRERIRQEERAEMAAHLHDSVLQSLAMIQRARTPQEMATLARAQERELRAWLYGQGRTASGDSLAAALDQVGVALEALHHVEIEVVHAGDEPVDERADALVQAAREAMTNAALHAGVERVSVFLEVEPDGVTVYVRDRGRGFDPAAVPADRRGIAESIRGRMERAGGTADVGAAPGEGTEVRLSLPRRGTP
jgi:signal transduction histidine kinase/phage shock protein PspC (stress-responsive transcriptional regulator)